MSDATEPTYEAPLPDDVYSTVEKGVIWVALGLILVALAGLVLAFDSVWTETLKPIVWDPVVTDAGVARRRRIHAPKHGNLHAQHAWMRGAVSGTFQEMETSRGRTHGGGPHRLGVPCARLAGSRSRRFFLILEGCFVHLSHHSPSPCGLAHRRCVPQPPDRATF